jgi:hypothetical protein
VHAVREHRERLGAEHMDLREHPRMVRQILQSLIVERGQPVTHERRLTIAENLDHEIAGRDLAQEYRLAPHRGGQRNRHELVHSRRGCDALVQLLPKTLRSRDLPIRKAVKEADELAEEPRAIGDGMNVECAGERRSSPWNRYVF